MHLSQVLVCYFLLILFILRVNIECHETIATVGGSIGNSFHSFDFPLKAGYGGIHVVKTHANVEPIIFVSDVSLCTVRRIQGNYSEVIAGTGICGRDVDSPDDALAIETRLIRPQGLYFNVSTNCLYILDEFCIRVLDLTSGYISKLTLTYKTKDETYGLGVQMTKFNADYYIADAYANFIWKLELTQVRDVAICSIVMGNNKVVNIDHCLGNIPTDCKLNDPRGVTFSPNGLMTVADTGNRRILQIDMNGYVKKLSINGAPVNMRPTQVEYIENNMLIANDDSYLLMYTEPYPVKRLHSSKNGVSFFSLICNENCQVYYLTDCRKPYTEIALLSVHGTSSVTQDQVIAGHLPYQLQPKMEATSYYLEEVGSIWFSNEYEVYFPAFSSVVLKVNLTSGLMSIVAGVFKQLGYTHDHIPSNQSLLSNPSSVIVLKGGEIIIADTNNNRIRMVDRNGIITTLVGTGIVSINYCKHLGRNNY